ncbi:hypothetical protein CgunFtcFv8_011694 [Champsocephalus gunnari]|uniref:Ubiquitin-like protease family profile domain-containing protein n=1 Tax=Champsocephalus gunnari TaxID=52237 RepID=A0AAN8D7C2_CHAGU|nr:hypothetical protein CgunFtcFv8_011694 [Champsocephalus gunnari]
MLVGVHETYSKCTVCRDHVSAIEGQLWLKGSQQIWLLSARAALFMGHRAAVGLEPPTHWFYWLLNVALVHPLPHRNPLSTLPNDASIRDAICIPVWKPGHFLLAKPFTVNTSWTVERDDWFEGFPRQLYGNDCGIFMLMYALYTILDAPYDFTITDMPALRKWWCVMLMANFDLGREI